VPPVSPPHWLLAGDSESARDLSQGAVSGRESALRAVGGEGMARIDGSAVGSVAAFDCAGSHDRTAALASPDPDESVAAVSSVAAHKALRRARAFPGFAIVTRRAVVKRRVVRVENWSELRGPARCGRSVASDDCSAERSRVAVSNWEAENPVAESRAAISNTTAVCVVAHSAGAGAGSAADVGIARSKPDRLPQQSTNRQLQGKVRDA
jgi:hypothetical protein